jgi:hypothetical protein
VWDGANVVTIVIIVVLIIIITIALATVITRGDAAYLHGCVGRVRSTLDEGSGFRCGGNDSSRTLWARRLDDRGEHSNCGCMTSLGQLNPSHAQCRIARQAYFSHGRHNREDTPRLREL